MPKKKEKKSKRLVIDANVLLSAGGEETSNQRAASCRDLLMVVYVECHKMVTTPDLKSEWEKKPTKHAKGRRLQAFARKWLCRMNGKSKVDDLGVVQNATLRRKIKQTDTSDKSQQHMLDDVHLLEAALTADEIVVSCDETARGLFQTASARIGEIRQIVWVNPDKEDEKPVDWLKQGAPKEVGRTLGHGID